MVAAVPLAATTAATAAVASCVVVGEKEELSLPLFFTAPRASNLHFTELAVTFILSLRYLPSSPTVSVPGARTYGLCK